MHFIVFLLIHKMNQFSAGWPWVDRRPLGPWISKVRSSAMGFHLFCSWWPETSKFRFEREGEIKRLRHVNLQLCWQCSSGCVKWKAFSPSHPHPSVCSPYPLLSTPLPHRYRFPPHQATVTGTREFQNATNHKKTQVNRRHNRSEIRRRATTLFHTPHSLILYVWTPLTGVSTRVSRRIFQSAKHNRSCCSHISPQLPSDITNGGTSPWERWSVLGTNGDHLEKYQFTPKTGK